MLHPPQLIVPLPELTPSIISQGHSCLRRKFFSSITWNIQIIAFPTGRTVPATLRPTHPISGKNMTTFTRPKACGMTSRLYAGCGYHVSSCCWYLISSTELNVTSIFIQASHNTHNIVCHMYNPWYQAEPFWAHALYLILSSQLCARRPEIWQRFPGHCVHSLSYHRLLVHPPVLIVQDHISDRSPLRHQETSKIGSFWRTSLFNALLWWYGSVGSCKCDSQLNAEKSSNIKHSTSWGNCRLGGIEPSTIG